MTAAAINSMLVATEQLMSDVSLQPRLSEEAPMSTFDPGQAFFSEAVQITPHLLAQAELEDLPALHRIGVACRICGQFSLAEQFYLKAVEVATGVFGPNSSEAALHRNFLAGLYFAWRRFTECKALVEESLRLYEQKLGLDHIHTRLTRFGLVLTTASLGETIVAKKLYEKTELRLYVTQSEAQSSDRWSALTLKLAGIAAIKYEQGLLAESIELFRYCVVNEANEAWPGNMIVARALNNLALLCRAQGLDLEAQEFFQMTMKMKEKIVGKNHPEYKITEGQYTELLRSSGKFKRLQS